ncbi:MAG: Plug domain-containing protein [Cytophagales bacterium]|nr:Plug domain-containing protein [Cytophagales bacterium]
MKKWICFTIKQAATPDFYDALANVKGVQTNSGSLNLTSINTRGFATIANVRFVQLVDGMDTQAPLLNFPTGNIIGIGELDAESVELVPGAASALYGPNAFNGILIMKSKSPFEYQGLSAQVKGGVTQLGCWGFRSVYTI